MRKYLVFWLGLIAISAWCAACAGWTATQTKTAENAALTATQIACVLASSFTDNESVAKACQIDAALMPALRQLVEGKAAAAAQLSSASRDAGADR